MLPTNYSSTKYVVGEGTDIPQEQEEKQERAGKGQVDELGGTKLEVAQFNTMAHEKSDLQVLEKVKSELSDHSCMDDDKAFDAGHVNQSSCDSEIEQESTDTNTGKTDLDSDDKENSNVGV
ncbi:hypothetical protein H920_00916 [Fukomys damarensis]|uniref:Uncharacterized protein n=1 Tax=Fukomys damarensis TaxID=885580 RepID=A0A091E080_FUKDA|nr:hypothetical protein H920_00916 [Fukomys damarensis]